MSGSIGFASVQEETIDIKQVIEHVEETMLSIYEVVEGIVAVPSHQQTFENTIKPCIDLTENLFYTFMLLYALREERTLQKAIDWELKKLSSFLKTEIFDNPQLQECLLIYIAALLDQRGALNAYKRCLVQLQDGKSIYVCVDWEIYRIFSTFHSIHAI